MDTLPFYIFLFAHLVFLILAFGSVLVTDFFGLRWALKKTDRFMFLGVAEITQRLIWLGWLGMVVSGAGLLYFKGYIDSLTWVKLFLVAMVGVNGIALHLIKESIARMKEGERVSNIMRFRIGYTGLVSQIGWWGAIFIGFIHRHWRHYIDWPPSAWDVLGPLIFGLLLLGILGEALLRPKVHQ